MKAASEHADDGFEDEWLERMSPRERRMYRARRASHRVNGSDLTDSQWREFARIRARHGDEAAHAYHDAKRAEWMAIDRAKLAPTVTIRTRVNAAAFTLLGRGLTGLLLVLVGTAFGGHLGFVFTASIAVCITAVATALAFGENKAM